MERLTGKDDLGYFASNGENSELLKTKREID